MVVTQKNSAPLSPAVSKVSSGAMEVFPIHSCNRMARLLNSARESGWDVIGADVADDSVPFQDVCTNAPSILVMGRTLAQVTL